MFPRAGQLRKRDAPAPVKVATDALHELVRGLHRLEVLEEAMLGLVLDVVLTGLETREGLDVIGLLRRERDEGQRARMRRGYSSLKPD